MEIKEKTLERNYVLPTAAGVEIVHIRFHFGSRALSIKNEYKLNEDEVMSYAFEKEKKFIRKHIKLNPGSPYPIIDVENYVTQKAMFRKMD